MSTLIDGPPPFLPGDTAAYAVVAWTITVAQYATCAVFLLFLAHKLLMLVVYPYVTRFDPVPGTLPRDRPFVTVQLPCYNESAVIRRVIDAACSMNWPRDRYEVHVLDDSNDQTVRGGAWMRGGGGGGTEGWGRPEGGGGRSECAEQR